MAHAPSMVPLGPMDTALRWGQPQANGSFNWVNEPVKLGLALAANTNNSQQTDDSFTLGWQGSLLGDRLVPTLGFRRDRNVSRATKTLAINPATGLLDTSGIHTFNPEVDTYGDTRTASVLVRPLKWLGLTYGQSRNFTPAAFRVDIFGQPLPLPTGRGKDYGVRLNLLDERLIFSLNYFESSAKNARGTPADSFMFRVSRFETGFITWANGVARSILGPGASAAAVSAKIAEITKLPADFVPPALATIASTSTVSARGVEAQAVFNPIRNWNMKATLGTQHTRYANIAPEYETYSTPRLPIWTAAVDPTTGLSFWSTNSSPDLGIPVNFWNVNIAAPMQLAKALEGKRTQGQRQWSASAISTYRFVEGRLKRIEIGGGLRLQDHAVIGYLGAAPDSAGVIRSLDPGKPVYDSPQPAFDFWVSKSFTFRKWFGREIVMKTQLNVRNAFEHGNWLQPIAVNPDGTRNAYRIVEPRAWYLDVKFLF